MKKHIQIVRYSALVAIGLTSAFAATAQERPPTPVKYTEAIEQSVQKSVELTGSVESRGASFVASEVQGVVVRLPARAGDRVKKGAPIVQLRRDTLELRVKAADGELEEAKARLRLAELSLQRAKDLHEGEVLSRDGLDQATAQSDATHGRVVQLEADLERLRLDLARTTIRSPYNGVVVRELTAPGAWVQVGGSVAEMIDLGDLEVTIEMPSQYFGGVKRGSQVSIRFEVLGKELEGTVRAVVPRADPQARTFPVKISVPNDGSLGVGILAQVRLPVGGENPAILVPKDAIVSQGADRIVYVIGSDDTVMPVNVSTGLSQSMWIEINGPVKRGDRVVTRGNERLRPGQTVQAEILTYELP